MWMQILLMGTNDQVQRFWNVMKLVPLKPNEPHDR